MLRDAFRQVTRCVRDRPPRPVTGPVRAGKGRLHHVDHQLTKWPLRLFERSVGSLWRLGHRSNRRRHRNREAISRIVKTAQRAGETPLCCDRSHGSWAWRYRVGRPDPRYGAANDRRRRRGQIREVDELERSPSTALEPERIRRPGGGRKKTVDKDPTLRTDLERLIDPATRGDPESPLRWTSKSIRRLAAELIGLGHATSARMVGKLLREMGYSFRRIARRSKEPAILTETRSSSSFATRWRRNFLPATRSFRSRRRNWLGTSRT